jgi:hypothetical protein
VQPKEVVELRDWLRTLAAGAVVRTLGAAKRASTQAFDLNLETSLPTYSMLGISRPEF